MKILAPCSGRVLPMRETPDPVFATETLGPGLVIDPDLDGGVVDVVSPVDGTLLKVYPHAFIVTGTGSADGLNVLVHLGIDTVKLEGEGFEVLGTKGDVVRAGDPVVRWDPNTIDTSDAGVARSVVVPVVLMEHELGTVADPADDAHVAAGDVLLDL